MGIHTSSENFDGLDGAALPNDLQQSEPAEEDIVNEQEDSRNIFDRIGDFFFRMVKGVFIFAILKLPRIIWRFVTCVEHLKFLLRYAKSIIRAVFWFVAWVTIVFAAWMAFGWEAFVRFWSAVGELMVNIMISLWNMLYENFGIIWMVIALIGSVYGLIFVTLKRRRSRRNADKESSKGVDAGLR